MSENAAERIEEPEATATGTAGGGEVAAKPILTVEAEVTAEVELDAEPVADLTNLDAPVGFEELAARWWKAVAEVHRVLLTSDPGIDTVTIAYAVELRARWEYAKALHEGGYQVPDYLAERAPVAPLWPAPEVPVPAGELARAA